jgi:hypothetical protein
MTGIMFQSRPLRSQMHCCILLLQPPLLLLLLLPLLLRTAPCQ